MKQKLARVVAIHDMSGYGKCSLTVAIPVISAAGIQVCPLLLHYCLLILLSQGLNFLTLLRK